MKSVHRKDHRVSGSTTHVNKIHHVTTITQVAKDLGECEDRLWDIANELEIEDGVIWVYGVGEDGTLSLIPSGQRGENFSSMVHRRAIDRLKGKEKKDE